MGFSCLDSHLFRRHLSHHLHSGGTKLWVILNRHSGTNPDRNIPRLRSKFSHGEVLCTIQRGKQNENKRHNRFWLGFRDRIGLVAFYPLICPFPFHSFKSSPPRNSSVNSNRILLYPGRGAGELRNRRVYWIGSNALLQFHAYYSINHQNRFDNRTCALRFWNSWSNNGLHCFSPDCWFSRIILVWTMYRVLPKSSTRTEVFSTIKTMLGYGIPVSIGNILTALLTAFYSYILAFYVTNNALIGNYNLAINFSILITFFATPVTTMLFPAFSKLDYRKDHDTLKNVFQYSVKYASLIVVPVSALMIALAHPGVGFIYHNSYASAPLFLALLSVTYIYSAFGSLSVSSLLMGQGFTKYNLRLSVLQVGIGVPVGFLLISNFGVVGLIASSLTVGLPSLFVGLNFLKKKFGVSVDWLSSVKILLSSAMAAILTYFVISKLPLALLRLAFWKIALNISIALQQLVIGAIAYVIIFVLAAVVTRTIDIGDLYHSPNH